MTNNFKIGDSVKLPSVRPDAWAHSGAMDKYLGKTVVITEIHGDCFDFEGSEPWFFRLSEATLAPKFKVGDMVKGKKIGNHYGITNANMIQAKVVGVHGNSIDIKSLKFADGTTGYNGKRWDYLDANAFELLTNNLYTGNSKIVITPCGNKTTAELFENGKVVKTTEAKCSPEDIFKLFDGASLALDRLFAPATSEVKEVERFAKLGEYIKITSVIGNDGISPYSVGDIFKVLYLSCFDGDVRVTHGDVIKERRDTIYVKSTEYVVLEDYTPVTTTPVTTTPVETPTAPAKKTINGKGAVVGGYIKVTDPWMSDGVYAIGDVMEVVEILGHGIYAKTVSGKTHADNKGTGTAFLDNREFETTSKPVVTPVTPATPKATVTKFKTGDKVKIIGNTKIRHFFGIGDVVTVTNPDSASYDKKDKPVDVEKADGSTQAIADCDLELVVETPATPVKHEYKVGDKVRIIAEFGGHGYEIGEVVELTEKNYGNWYSKSTTGTEKWYIMEREFEFVSEPVTEVKHEAKVGDYIKLIAEPKSIHNKGQFKIGDIVKITDFGCMPSVYGKDGGFIGFRTYEYVVLENYVPATVSDVKVTEIKRSAKVGDKIKITGLARKIGGTEDRMSIGEIFTVERSDSEGVYVKHPRGQNMGCMFIWDKSYVVLEEKVVEVKRNAEVGEYVKITKTDTFKQITKDDILEVISLGTYGMCYLRTKTHNSHYKGDCSKTPISKPFTYVEPSDYVVLENYTPSVETPVAPTTTKKVIERKRHANVGEYIKIVSAYNNFDTKDYRKKAFVNGDILQVKEVLSNAVKTTTKAGCGSNMSTNGTRNLVYHCEYVVLENYVPATESVTAPADKIVVGSRVTCSTKGIGTVIGIDPRDDEMMLVEFDNNIHGHDGYGSPVKTKGKYGHCWYCSVSALELITEAPTPVTYKSGDKVRVTKDTCFHSNKVGSILTLKSICGHADREYNRAWMVDEACTYIRESDFEAYTDPTLKVGDEAKVIGNTFRHYYDLGDTVKITEEKGVNGNFHCVRESDGRCQYVRETDLQKI